MTPSEKQDNPFAELNLNILKTFVKGWVENAEQNFGWPKILIKSISLYICPPIENELLWKYAVVVDTKSPERKIVNGSWQKEPDPPHKSTNVIFNKKSFRSIYKSEPQDDSYKDDWILKIRLENTSLRIAPNDAPNMILYETNNDRPTFQEIRVEIEQCYAA